MADRYEEEKKKALDHFYSKFPEYKNLRVITSETKIDDSTPFVVKPLFIPFHIFNKLLDHWKVIRPIFLDYEALKVFKEKEVSLDDTKKMKQVAEESEGRCLPLGRSPNDSKVYAVPINSKASVKVGK